MAIKICLDAGHYGKYNKSTVNSKYYESEMSWKLHNYLKDELKSYGITVITTRTNQAKDLDVYNRGTASKGCDLFLSIHSNASSSEKSNFALACCQTKDGKKKVYETSEKIGKLLAECVNKTMNCTGKSQILQKVGNNNTDYYGVLRGAKAVGTPAVLLEHGFHTNKANTEWLLKDANLKKMAQEEAKVIANYFGVKKNSNSNNSTSNSNNTSNKTTTSDFKPYVVRVVCSSLNIRKTPKWDKSDVAGVVKYAERYTIVGEVDLDGTKFGKLKSGAGYISLGAKYVKKV